jgi:tight adherence protein C
MEVLNALLGPDSDLSGTLLFVLAIGATVCLLAYGVTLLVSGATDPVRRRVAAATAQSAGGSTKSKVDFGWFTQRFSKYLTPKQDEQESTGQRLIQAGFRSPDALRQFYGIKAVAAIGLFFGALIGVRWAPQLSSNSVLVIVGLAAFSGLRLPDIVLSKLRENRIKRLRNGFPDALDLLVVCVESGLGLAPAIERVSRELEISHEDLAEELALVNAEIRAGVERPVALRNLATRSGVPDIRGLVGLLTQTIRFGTSVADALRVYSEEFRDKRMQRAEEQAAKMGTKMIFPLVLFLFPSFFIVAVGPAVLRLAQAFQSMQ